MKKETIILKNFLVLCMMLWSTIMNGQFLPPIAGYTEIPSSSGGTMGRSTGNDIYEDVNGTGDIYRVNVWEPAGATVAFSWNVDIIGVGNFQANLPISYMSAFHPDVCLIYDGNGKVYAVVAYFDPGSSSWYVEPFEWISSNQFISLGSTLIEVGTPGTTVNIDGDPNGQYTVVYDNGSVIRAFEGDLTGSPFNTAGPVTIEINATMPDVSLYDCQGTTFANIAFVTNTGTLTCYTEVWIDIWNNAHWPIYLSQIVQPPLRSYYFPRIATPGDGGCGYIQNWHIIVEESDGTDHRISGFNCTALTVTAIEYNYGSRTIPTNIPGTLNYACAVTYDSNYPTNGIWVGWTMDNSVGNVTTTGVVDAIYPILIQCDNTGVPLNFNDYWQVPDNVISGDYSSYLSLSGRFGSDRLYTSYLNYTNNGSSVFDVISKDMTIVSLATSCKVIENNNENSIADIIKVNQNLLNENTILNLKIYNLHGDIYFEKQIQANELKSILNYEFPNLNSSIYLVQVQSQDGTYNKVNKVLISR